MMRVGMTRCEKWLEREGSYREWVKFGHADIGTCQTVHVRVSDLTTGQAAQSASRSQMVGVDVGFERCCQSEVQFLQQSQVALDGFEYRIDQNCLAGFAARHEVSVGRGFRFEQLTKYHLINSFDWLGVFAI